MDSVDFRERLRGKADMALSTLSAALLIGALLAPVILTVSLRPRHEDEPEHERE